MSLFIIFLGARLIFLRDGAPLLTFPHRFPCAFAATTSQYANEILGELSHLFRHYIPRGRWVCRLAFSDIGKDFATATPRLAAHCFVSNPHKRADQAQILPKKLPIPCPR